ncbi:Serine/threonine-protein kinase SAPK2 [Platanthera guangdongensis]|uniref:Serine/threonine-protein kinase SAPK2 n=1 Tax=Platanthera guangdongensis TaxID=2320717 RepID=A0ABR2LM70_9ASPA
MDQDGASTEVNPGAFPQMLFAETVLTPTSNAPNLIMSPLVQGPTKLLPVSLNCPVMDEGTSLASILEKKLDLMMAENILASEDSLEIDPHLILLPNSSLRKTRELGRMDQYGASTEVNPDTFPQMLGRRRPKWRWRAEVYFAIPVESGKPDPLLQRILNVQYLVLHYVWISVECNHLLSRIFVSNPEKVKVRVFSVGYPNKFVEVVVGSASMGDEYVTCPTGYRPFHTLIKETRWKLSSWEKP